jgi:hypothetical protein
MFPTSGPAVLARSNSLPPRPQGLAVPQIISYPLDTRGGDGGGQHETTRDVIFYAMHVRSANYVDQLTLFYNTRGSLEHEANQFMFLMLGIRGRLGL